MTSTMMWVLLDLHDFADQPRFYHTDDRFEIETGEVCIAEFQYGCLTGCGDECLDDHERQVDVDLCVVGKNLHVEEHFVNGLARLFRHKAHHLRPFTAHQRVDGRFKEIRNRRQERYIRQGIVVLTYIKQQLYPTLMHR